MRKSRFVTAILATVSITLVTCSSGPATTSPTPSSTSGGSGVGDGLSPTPPSGFVKAATQTLVSGRIALPGVGAGKVTMLETHLSLNPGQHGSLVTVRAIAKISATCANGSSAVRIFLTNFAAGEGPPEVIHTSRSLARHYELSSLPPISLLTHIPSSAAGGQTLDFWQVGGGGEAFSFTATIWSLRSVTARGNCQFASQAFVDVRGPFYRNATQT